LNWIIVILILSGTQAWADDSEPNAEPKLFETQFLPASTKPFVEDVAEFKKRGYDFKKCERPSPDSHPTYPFDQDGKVIPECAPDVLYSWQTNWPMRKASLRAPRPQVPRINDAHTG